MEEKEKIKGLWWGVAICIVAGIVMGILSHDYLLEKRNEALTLAFENAEIGYKDGFGGAFEWMVECFEAREGIVERDAEWESVWEQHCKWQKEKTIHAIVMGEYLPFPNAFCIKSANLSCENTTFLDRGKNPIPCGRDVLTGKCINDVYNTTYRHIALNWSGYEGIRVIVIKYNGSQVDDITITEGLEDTYIIYMVMDDGGVQEPTTAEACFPNDGFCTNIEFERRGV